ncbi:MAG: helix-turn-helix transcriptional regulator [Eubacteriales bacterium]|nr:helix-turn-helix transcriptional regulator [Eubacteriales bacterium]
MEKSIPNAETATLGREWIDGITDCNLLRQLCIQALLKGMEQEPLCSHDLLMELLTNLQEAHTYEQLSALLKKLLSRNDSLMKASGAGAHELSERVMRLVEEHIGNPCLSLRWLCEQFLFMNVDYVSRRFSQETGIRFSAFLTQTRIRIAKTLLLTIDEGKIYTVAHQIGCGNNPQYFWQVFKRMTGMTPSAYIKKML